MAIKYPDQDSNLPIQAGALLVGSWSERITGSSSELSQSVLVGSFLFLPRRKNPTKV
jgi:hypothetical protein